MSLYFIKSGMQTSIQDLGRQGQMHNGISHSGAMDLIALKVANWLLSNPLNSPVIEITLVGPVIRFEQDMFIAISGAQFELSLNNKSICNNEKIKVTSGDILSFGKLINGTRAYLSLSTKIDVPKIFNSYSTHLTVNFGGYKGRSFKNGEKLNCLLLDRNKKDDKKVPKYVNNAYTGSYILRCTTSVETNLFTEKQKANFIAKKYSVNANSNRMGIRLNESALEFENPIEITSSGLMQGSIQITPAGLPIISSVDGQTIGGYPRIANIITSDLPLLGQLKANDKVSFMFISHNQANKIFNKQQQALNFLDK